MNDAWNASKPFWMVERNLLAMARLPSSWDTAVVCFVITFRRNVPCCRNKLRNIGDSGQSSEEHKSRKKYGRRCWHSMHKGSIRLTARSLSRLLTRHCCVPQKQELSGWHCVEILDGKLLLVDITGAAKLMARFGKSFWQRALWSTSCFSRAMCLYIALEKQNLP